jgi:hypothetical protein
MTTPPNAKPAASDIDDKGVASGLTVSIKGRVKHVERFKAQNSGKEYVRTLIVIPAKDIYSHPSTFCVLSEYPLGAKDVDVEARCELRPSNNPSTKNPGEYFHNLSLWLFQ